MTARQRPISVIVVACLCLIVWLPFCADSSRCFRGASS
jgi:hypothetical protein